MAPILETLIALAVGVLFRLLLLRKVPLAVSNHLPHMVNIILIILVKVLFRVLLQYSNNFTPTVVPDSLLRTIIFGP